MNKSKRLMVSLIGTHINNILEHHNIIKDRDSDDISDTRKTYDDIADNKGFGTRFLNAGVLFDETVFTKDVLAELPKDYIAIVDIPEGYSILSDNIAGDIQTGLLLVKDLQYIKISDDTNIISDTEKEKLKPFIVPFNIEDK